MDTQLQEPPVIPVLVQDTRPAVTIPKALPAKAASSQMMATNAECRLLVSNATRKLYPEGFLEKAAEECWAGPNTDILVVGKRDASKQSGHYMRVLPETVRDTQKNLSGIIPKDWEALLEGPKDRDGKSIIYTTILRAAIIPDNSFALKYRFEPVEGSKETSVPRNLFITIVDPQDHSEDHLAGMSGLFLGYNISSNLIFNSRFSDSKSWMALTFAHEATHGEHDHGIKIVSGNQIKDNIEKTPVAERMQHEGGADVGGAEKYMRARNQGVSLNEIVPAINWGLRSLGSYFNARVGNIPFAHATNFSFSKEAAHTTPTQQEEGLRIFRDTMDTAFGRVILDPETGDYRESIRDITTLGQEKDDFITCRDDALDALPKGTSFRDNWDKYAYDVSQCVLQSIWIRPLGAAAIIELEKEKDPFKGNIVARRYAEDFKTAVSAHLMSAGNMERVGNLYDKVLKDDLPAPAKAHWGQVLGR